MDLFGDMGAILKSIVSNSYYGILQGQKHRESYMVARRYEFYVPVVRKISNK